MSELQPINFTRGVPANESFPIDDITDAAKAILKQNGAAIMQYGPALGFAPLREWIAEWQGVQPNQVLNGNGWSTSSAARSSSRATPCFASRPLMIAPSPSSAATRRK